MNFESRLPTECFNIFEGLIGDRVVSVTRYSWWAPSVAASTCGLADSDVFSFTAGPVTIEFESGIVLGMASDSSSSSIETWLERDAAGNILRNEPLEDDEGLYKISSVDPVFSNDFWSGVIGFRVDRISIWRRLYNSPRLSALPCQVGVCFLLRSGAEIVAAHGLHADSDDFTIIPKGAVLPSIQESLMEICVLE